MDFGLVWSGWAMITQICICRVRLSHDDQVSELFLTHEHVRHSSIWHGEGKIHTNWCSWKHMLQTISSMGVATNRVNLVSQNPPVSLIWSCKFMYITLSIICCRYSRESLNHVWSKDSFKETERQEMV